MTTDAQTKESNDTTTSHWTELNDSTFEHLFAKPALLNSNEIIMASEDYIYIEEDTDEDVTWSTEPGIYKYNIKEQTCSLFIEYNINSLSGKHHRFAYHTMTLDNINNTLYVFDGDGSLLMIDILTHSKTWYKSQYQNGIYLGSIVINGEFHVVGGYSKSRHLIWNIQSKQFDQIYEFEEDGRCGFELVYVKSKQLLYIFGGCSSASTLDSILIYCIPTKKWTKCNVKLPVAMSDVPAVLTADEKYVILFDSESMDPGIYIVELSNMKIRKSNVDMVTYNQCYAVYNTNLKYDTMLVFGYLRQYETVFFPVEIAQLIFNWYNTDSIYLFEAEYSAAPKWKILLQDLFDWSI